VNLPQNVYGVNILLVTALTPSSPRPYHHGDLRNALVQAAVELARDGGPDAIVLRVAARRVGVTATAAYRHFASLPELVDAAAGECIHALARSMQAEKANCRPSGDAERDAWEMLGAVGRAYVHFAINEPGLFITAFTSPKQLVRRDPPAADADMSARDVLEQALDGLITIGALSADDRAAAATMAWASVHGLSTLFLGPLREVPPADRDTAIETTLDLISRGLSTMR
jgi:AcrR family transcriptional regulator